jgi:hypothetical protein
VPKHEGKQNATPRSHPADKNQRSYCGRAEERTQVPSQNKITNNFFQKRKEEMRHYQVK